MFWTARMTLLAVRCTAGGRLASAQAHAGNAWVVRNVDIQVDQVQPVRMQVSAGFSYTYGKLAADCPAGRRAATVHAVNI